MQTCNKCRCLFFYSMVLACLLNRPSTRNSWLLDHHAPTPTNTLHASALIILLKLFKLQSTKVQNCFGLAPHRVYATSVCCNKSIPYLAQLPSGKALKRSNNSEVKARKSPSSIGPGTPDAEVTALLCNRHVENNNSLPYTFQVLTTALDFHCSLFKQHVRAFETQRESMCFSSPLGAYHN